MKDPSDHSDAVDPVAHDAVDQPNPNIDLTVAELRCLEEVAASKGYDLWIEPCGECCDDPVIRIQPTAGLSAVEAEWFLINAPNLLEGLPDPGAC